MRYSQKQLERVRRMLNKHDLYVGGGITYSPILPTATLTAAIVEEFTILGRLIRFWTGTFGRK